MPKIFLFILTLLSLNSWADQEIMPVIKVFSSPNHSHYLKLVPAKDFDPLHARGYVYKTGSPSDQLLYEINNWYSPSVLISAGGQYIARLGPWPTMVSPANKTLALAFYKNGSLTKTYMISDLVLKPKELPHTVSHYNWGGDLKWAGNRWNDTVQVTTKENETLKFDIKTGERLE